MQGRGARTRDVRRAVAALGVAAIAVVAAGCVPPPPPPPLKVLSSTTTTTVAQSPGSIGGVGATIGNSRSDHALTGPLQAAIIGASGQGKFSIPDPTVGPFPDKITCIGKALPWNTACRVSAVFESLGTPGVGTATLRISDGVNTLDIPVTGIITPDP